MDRIRENPSNQCHPWSILVLNKRVARIEHGLR